MTTRSPGLEAVTPSPSAATMPAPSAPRMRGFGTEGRPWRSQRSRWFSEAARRADEHLARRPARGPGTSSQRRAPRARRPRESGRPSSALTLQLAKGVCPRVLTQGELRRLAAELGIDAIGAAPAEPYDETERHIRDRRARGLFAGHALHHGAARGVLPSGAALSGGAHRRLRGALLLRAGPRSRGRARGGCRATRGATPTRRCASSSTTLGASARRRRTACSSTRTSTWTARARPGQGSASTARTRCSSPAATDHGSCSARS